MVVLDAALQIQTRKVLHIQLTKNAARRSIWRLGKLPKQAQVVLCRPMHLIHAPVPFYQKVPPLLGRVQIITLAAACLAPTRHCLHRAEQLLPLLSSIQKADSTTVLQVGFLPGAMSCMLDLCKVFSKDGSNLPTQQNIN